MGFCGVTICRSQADASPLTCHPPAPGNNTSVHKRHPKNVPDSTSQVPRNRDNSPDTQDRRYSTLTRTRTSKRLRVGTQHEEKPPREVRGQATAPPGCAPDIAGAAPSSPHEPPRPAPGPPQARRGRGSRCARRIGIPLPWTDLTCWVTHGPPAHQCLSRAAWPMDPDGSHHATAGLQAGRLERGPPLRAQQGRTHLSRSG